MEKKLDNHEYDAIKRILTIIELEAINLNKYCAYKCPSVRSEIQSAAYEIERVVHNLYNFIEKVKHD